MAKRDFTTCPVCGCEVSKGKLHRHIRKVHPKKAKEHGAARRKKKGTRAKTLSTKKLEQIEVQKRKSFQKNALIGSLIAIAIVALILLWHFWGDIFPEKGNPVVVMETSEGAIEFELYEDEVPDTVKNFKKYVKDGFFEDLIFHRVANLDASQPNSHIIQGGGFKPGMVRKEATYSPIELEVKDKLIHEDGSVAMARTSDPNSATSQFYICDGPQPHLDGEYAVFGKVTSGMSVVRAIANKPVHTVGGYENVPVDDIIIENVSLK
jgi:peptidyl-prolyl cis-trans isomerase A (cyclophilin A)